MSTGRIAAIATVVITFAALMACGLGACHLDRKAKDHEESIHYQGDVTWLKVGDVEVKVDVSRPEGAGPFPVVVWFHGGGWQKYSREISEGSSRYISARGYVVMNFDYRLAPSVHMKTIIEDALGAVAWAKDHAAQYHGDPARVAVAGHSAGAHLAAMAAMACGDPYFTPSYQSGTGNDCHVQAFVPVAGVFEFDKPPELDRSEEQLESIFGATPKQARQLYHKCSPASYVRPDLPPQLVVYAGDDPLRAQSEAYIAQLRKIDPPYQTYMQPGAGHVWVTLSDTKPARQTYDRIIAFLVKELKAK